MVIVTAQQFQAIRRASLRVLPGQLHLNISAGKGEATGREPVASRDGARPLG
jgi:hypothetical protein